MSRGSCLNSCVFTEYILYSMGPVSCATRGARGAFSYGICSRSITEDRCKEDLIMFSILLTHLSKRISLSLPRKSIPEAPVTASGALHARCS